MGICSAGLRVLLVILSISITQGALPRARFRRNVGTLHVTWQDKGFHKIEGVGYLVEYKTADGDEWIVYPSLVPYVEDNKLREIKIYNLESNASYEVRVKLVGKNGETIALSEGYTTAVWKDTSGCQSNEVSYPKDVRVKEVTEMTMIVDFEKPDCGFPTSYLVEVSGVGDASFHYQTYTVTRPPATVAHLLPQTEYSVRVRAADEKLTQKPWSQPVLVTTDGNNLVILGSVTIDYRTNSDIRISWPDDYNEDLQTYKVYATPVGETTEKKDSQTMDIPRPSHSSLFTNLKPDTEYALGVVAYKGFKPNLYYRINAKTVSNSGMLWDDKPKINEESPNSYIVSWTRPEISHPIEYYVIEYRSMDNNTWWKYKTVMNDDDQFSVSINNGYGKVFYSIRILAIDDQNRLVLKTPETRVGSIILEPCIGSGGIPKNIRYKFISDNAVQFSWDKPLCESSRPVSGYEYQFWEAGSQNDEGLDSFVSDPVLVRGELKPATQYSFRVRSRVGPSRSLWSETINVRTDSFSSQGTSNLYRLRYISQPKSYLVWTPLAEDLEHVLNFRLSYKEIDSDEWTEIVETPDAFKCPSEIAFDVADYCYELSDPAIKTGVQYAGNVLYETDRGQWSKKSDPVYFIIASTGNQMITSAPNHLKINTSRFPTVELEWLAPFGSAKIEFYQITVKNMRSGYAKMQKINGTVYKHVVENLLPNTLYNISVQAGTENSDMSPAAWKLISLSQFRYASDRHEPYPISINDIEAVKRDSRIQLRWSIIGNAGDVAAYKIEIRRPGDASWRQVIGPVRHDSSQQSFGVELPRFGLEEYFFRIAAIDNKGTVLVTSAPYRITSDCQAPIFPPQNVHLEDSEVGVRARWTYDIPRGANCQLRFRITGYENRRPFTHSVDGNLREYVFPNSGGGEWQIRVQAENQAGQGPQSDTAILRKTTEVNVGVRTQRSVCDTRLDFWCRNQTDIAMKPTSSEALISMPRIVDNAGGRLVVEWESKGNGRDIVSYLVQFRTDDVGWRSNGQYTPYAGDNKVYRQTLYNLQRGTTYYIHIQALDASQTVRFTSGEVPAKTACSSPTQAPLSPEIVAPDSRHVRVSWIPPPPHTWQCNDVIIELQVQEPGGIGLVKIEKNKREHVFDASPNQDWAVALRVINPVGASAWSQTVTTKTPSTEDLIVGLKVTYGEGMPRITWRSKEGYDKAIGYYRVEWRPRGSEEWRKHGNQIPHFGWQRSYSVDLQVLTEAPLYDVRVKAFDNAENVIYTSPSVAVQVQPRCLPPTSPPNDIRASAIGASQVQLRWQPLPISDPKCAIWYVIEYSTPQYSGLQNISMEKTQHLFDSKPFTRWTFRIQAANVMGESPWSEPVSTQTLGTAPSPIYDLQMHPKSTSIYMTWRAPRDSSGQYMEYEITYQLLNRGNCGFSTNLPANKITTSQTTFTISDLFPYSKYRVTVTPKTTITGKSFTQDVDTAESSPSASPFDIRVDNVRSTEINLSWEPPPCSARNGEITDYEYELQSSAHPNSVMSIKNTGGAQTKVIVSGLNPMTAYGVRLRAYTHGGPGPWSELRNFQTTQIQQILPPADIKVLKTGPDNAHLVWQDSHPGQTYIDKYKCRYSVVGRNDYKERQFPAYNPCSQEVISSENLPTLPSGSLFHCGKIDGLEKHKEYQFEVAAGSSAQNQWSDWSSACSRPVGCNRNLDRRFNSPPTVVSVYANTVTIEWEAPSGDYTHFRIQFREVHGSWKNVKQVSRHQTYGTGALYRTIINELPFNQVIYFRVIAVYPNIEEVPSEEVSATTKCAPPPHPPDALNLDSVSAEETRITWARPARNIWLCDQIEYEISYRIGEKDGIKILPGHITEWIVKTPPNVQVFVKIRTKNMAGHSNWSQEKSITTRQGIPGPVQNLKLTPRGPSEIFISWEPPSEPRGKIVGYYISYRLKYRLACRDDEPRDSSREFVTLPPLKTTNHLLSGLLPYAMYEVKVSARTSDLGPEETREIATEPKAPSGPPVDVDILSVTPTTVTFTWSEVECSMRLGPILSYEYEILGQDDWAKMLRLIDNQTETTLRITDLIPYTKYIMRVRAFNSVGGGPFCQDKHFTTEKAEAPLPPQDLLVSLEGTDFLSITWLPPYPPYGPHDAHKIQYRLNDSSHWNKWVEVEKNANDAALECVNRGRLCYTINGLQSGREYLIRVATRIKGGSFGPFCPEIVASTLQVLPDAPQRIAVLDRTDQSLNISWVPPADSHLLKQYKVAILKSGGSKDDERTYFVNHPQSTLFIDRLEPETLYNISVSARADGDFGRWASAVFDTDIFKPPSLKDPPLVTPDGANALDVFWKGLMDSKTSKWVKAYIIEYRSGSDSEFQEYGPMIPHDPTKVDYNAKIMRLNPDTLYYVRIKLADMKRVGEAGPEAKAKTGCDKPALPPFNIKANAPSSVKVVLNWEEPDYTSWRCSDINYVIEYTNGTSPPRRLSVPRITEYAFDSSPNTLWTIRLLVNNSAGESEWSRKITITTAEGAPGSVDDLDVTDKDGKALVSWSPPKEPNGDINKYTVKYWLKSLGECGPQQGIPVIKEVTSPKILIDDLIPDATYGFTVVAHTSLPGKESEVFDYQTPQAPPTGSPKNIRVDPVDKRSANVIWEKPDCELRNGPITGYSGELKALDEWGNDEEAFGAAESALFENLVPFTRYQIRVKATNEAGEGPFSDWIQFTTLSEAPSPPTDLVEEDSFPEAIEISFLPPSPPFGILSTYKIRSRKLDDKRGKEKEVKVRKEDLQCSDRSKKDRLCYRVAELIPEQEYVIDVAAYTENGGWSEWSNQLTSRTHDQEIPVPEQTLKITDEKAEVITVEWEGLDAEKAAHIIGYVLEYKAADDDEWQTYNGVVKHKPRQNKYKVQVKGLVEATEYFFHLRIVGINNKKGAPGPDATGRTKCGRPQEPPSDIHLHPVGFDKVQVLWKKPSPETWRCDNVQYLLEYRNTTVPRGTIIIAHDLPSELLLDTLPGAKWEIRMRTETVEEGQKPQYSAWSDWKILSVKPHPGEIFVDVQVQSPTSAVVTWDLDDDDRLWSHGVDLVAKLIKAGGCDKTDNELIVKKNVHDKRIRLDGLLPGSEYELTVTPRRFPNGVHDLPKTVKKFTTHSDIPSGPPTNLHPKASKETVIAFAWEPPLCHEQNGEIDEYLYSVEPVDTWNKLSGTQESATKQLWAQMDGLMSGSTYRVKVRAKTKAGPGPWSEYITIKTTGSEVDRPLDLTAIQTTVNSVSLTWRPPFPERAPVESYKVTHSPGGNGAESRDVQFNLYELTCSAFQPNPNLEKDSLCGTIQGLKPNTTYRFTVQGKSASSEEWGLPSQPHYATTREKGDRDDWGGIRLISASYDGLKVKWTPPEVIRNAVSKYYVNISVASSLDKMPKQELVDAPQTEKEFRNLEPVTRYNITVQAYSPERSVWYAQGVFDTTDYASGIVPWLTAPIDLSLYDKSDVMLHVQWSPPVLGDPEKIGEITEYRVTIAPYDQTTGKLGKVKVYTVDAGRRTIILDGLTPETIYNVTVQAMTDSGYGEMAWAVYSTLPPGQEHILRLLHRTPTSLTVAWEAKWPVDDHYVLQWVGLHSAIPHARLKKLHTEEIESTRRNFTITDLDPSTTYNVSVRPKNQVYGAWGAYATLPPGWYMVQNLVWCAREEHAVSLKWDSIENDLASDYMIRYKSSKDGTWSHEEGRAVEMLCPRDPDPAIGTECKKRCFLVFNLPHKSTVYDFHVRAKVNGVWNRWRNVGIPEYLPKPGQRNLCCIVPPVGFVEHIGSEGTSYATDIAPVAKKAENVTRYYVIVDERIPPGDTNWTYLTDRRTAYERGYNYYIAASYTPETLNDNRKMIIGDGKVIGGYLNYPLKKGKQYSHKFLAIWDLDGKPGVVGTWTAQPYIAGWPWWWLLLLLLLLLLLILLTCCLLWCLQRRFRARKERRILVGEEQTRPLLRENGDRREMEENMHKLSETVGKIRSEIEQSSARNARGDFEDGYVRGFRDANKLGSASAARGFMHDEYGSRDDRFHEGYVKGLRDAGMTGMSTSMRNLARDREPGGYSSGYMQGFRDGNSGVFGDRISTNLLRRLEEQYPNQEEFRTGYIDGFKEGASSRTSEHRTFEETRRLQESLTKLTEILQDKSKGGDEIHTTKIYHVYNQTPEALSTAYTATSAKHLERELEELTSSSSRRNTLRKHYTPGDYLKYGSEAEGYGSLGRTRRSLSASALGRESNAEQSRYHTGTGASYISRSSAADRSTADTFSRRYNYRSRSDMGSPRRYASQTLLDGTRPGPSTPHARRDALNTLQRELDTLSRSPDRSTPRGYSSDTGYINDSIRSRNRGYSNYDYDSSYQASRSEVKTTSPLTAVSGTRSTRYPVSVPVRPSVSSSYSYRKEGSGAEASSSSHNWPNDLTDIVNEPMGQTLERMKKYSSSMSQMDRDGGAADEGVKESIEERYQRSYKEEYTTGGQ